MQSHRQIALFLFVEKQDRGEGQDFQTNPI